MDQTILAVDDNGNFLEYIPKETGHTGLGKRHLAITVLLYNSQGQVLLQRRKHQIFDNIWDFTGATHPLHLKDSRDETLAEATQRCLEVEYGIKEKIPFKNLGFFNYLSSYGEFCENEHCAMMVGKYDRKVEMDPSVGYEYQWIGVKEFLEDVEKNSQKYAPWVGEGVKILKQTKFPYGS